MNETSRTRLYGHRGGTTPVRAVRIPETLWAALGTWCLERGITRSEAIRIMITNQIGANNEA